MSAKTRVRVKASVRVARLAKAKVPTPPVAVAPAPPTRVETAQITQLLEQSRQAHLRYRENLPRRVPSGAATVAVPGNATEAWAAMLEACSARLQAETLDPTHMAPAWGDEPVTHDHDALLTFYGEQLR